MSECVMNPIKAGELVVLSSGEYSDYSYLLVCKALRDISEADINSLVPDCRVAGWEEGDGETRINEYKLALELIRRKWVEDLPCREIHVGSYGDYDLDDCGSPNEFVLGLQPTPPEPLQAEEE